MHGAVHTGTKTLPLTSRLRPFAKAFLVVLGGNAASWIFLSGEPHSRTRMMLGFLAQGVVLSWVLAFLLRLPDRRKPKAEKVFLFTWQLYGVLAGYTIICLYGVFLLMNR